MQGNSDIREDLNNFKSEVNLRFDKIEKKLRKNPQLERPAPADVFDVLKSFCVKKNISIGDDELISQAEGFVDYYDSIGWEYRGNKIKKWEPRVSTWIKRMERSLPSQQISQPPQLTTKNKVTMAAIDKILKKGDL